MKSSSLTSGTPNNFSFPYEKPYDIQLQYMEQLFNTIQDEKIGIFESPTGSGKSLSLICGALSWLMSYYAQRDGTIRIEDHDRIGSSSSALKRKNKENDSSSDEEPAWVIEQTMKRKKEEEETARREQLEKSKKNVKKYDDRRKQFLESILKVENTHEDDNDLLLNEVDDCIFNKIGINNNLLKDLYDEDSDDDDHDRPIFSSGYSTRMDNEDRFETPKILYCTRTHSQINQFIQELRKTEFSKKVKVSNLASRQVLCINEHVLYRSTKNGKVQNSLNRMNEQCQYLRDKKLCEYDNDPSLFKDYMVLKVHDIEELLDLGKKLKICSYYGTRKAMHSAELVCMPYNSLVHEQTRKSLGVTSLKDCVVIIDEAHNLVSAIHQMHSNEIDIHQLTMVHDTLLNYFNKFKNRLSTTNQTNIKRLLNIIQGLMTFLTTENISDSNKVENGFIISITDLLFKTKMDNINLFQVAEFIEKSDLTKKLNMFMERQEEHNHDLVIIHNNNTVKRAHHTANYIHYSNSTTNNGNHKIDLSNTPTTSNNAINNVVSMLLALMNVDKDGKLFIKPNSHIKFLLLNPSVYFQSIVKEARSIILTGGTMEPIHALIQQVFPNIPSSKIHIYQCEKHIVPPNHFLPIVLTKGVGDIEFDFRFQNRQNNQDLIKSLGRTIVNMCNIVPDGIVLFFPSYQFEKTVFQYWKSNGIIDSIEKKKKFLREASANEDPNMTLDRILQEYKKIIDHNFGTSNSPITSAMGGSSNTLQRYNGSVLSCVVGGKLSEGINFSDGYGRLVVVIGLPYPNPNDIELIEQQKFFEQHTQQCNKNEYLDNICMNGVNQSIGRAIRHGKDYATVLLLDKRYQQQRLINKLSKWIRKDIVTFHSVGNAMEAVGKFYNNKRANQLEIEKERKEKWNKSITPSTSSLPSKTLASFSKR
ncbi:hypothetical protein C9374_008953 [Naegleria lovaniensis]|uniref:Helicase ATP-binding domain-containing protein n=1 Tax=Naegleria lovaniensis TaxID=51637 RepID=A0AA88GG05_NAELO|nr:uncharacterized protein C9374_008953 [Naegleria lovaniensis]KAG2377868.1 hypothetical protein C9374_008953 [Naegleria lovaniensis]